MWRGWGGGGRRDCEQSPFCFQFSEGSARARKQRAARNEGQAAGEETRETIRIARAVN